MFRIEYIIPERIPHVARFVGEIKVEPFHCFPHISN